MRQKGCEIGSVGMSYAVGRTNPLYGAAWSIGWELGRAVTHIDGYHENVRVPLQKSLNWIGVGVKK